MFFRLVKSLPIATLGILLLLAIIFDWTDYVSLESFRTRQLGIVAFIQSEYYLSILIFIGLYVVSTALSIPGALILTMIGGYLFGAFLGAFFSLIGAVVGASILFIAARSAFGDLFKPKMGSSVERMRKELTKNAFFYLLSLRLAPIFPFFVINIAPAFLNISFSNFFFASLFGMIPGTGVYALMGSGLHKTLIAGERFYNIPNVSLEFLAGLVGLAVLSLVPILIRRWKNKDFQ